MLIDFWVTDIECKCSFWKVSKAVLLTCKGQGEVVCAVENEELIVLKKNQNKQDIHLFTYQ